MALSSLRSAAVFDELVDILCLRAPAQELCSSMKASYLKPYSGTASKPVTHSLRLGTSPVAIIPSKVVVAIPDTSALQIESQLTLGIVDLPQVFPGCGQ